MLSKCAFDRRGVEILGHRVSPEGVSPFTYHVKSIQYLVKPVSGDELMCFLGHMNYFARFVDHFAHPAKPFFNVLKVTGFLKKRRPGQRLLILNWDKQ